MSKGTSLVVHAPTSQGDNDAVRAMAVRILDFYEVCTPKQVAIAATVYGYYKPAEQMTDRQAWNLNQANALINASFGEPAGDL